MFTRHLLANRIFIFSLAVLAASLFFSDAIFSQTLNPTQVLETPPKTYFDSTDLFTIVFGGDVGNKPSLPKQGELMYMLVPLISYSPSTGTNFGVGITGAFFMGNPDTTSISSFSSSLNVTTKKQLMATAKGTFMTPDNDYEILTDLRYFIYSQSTFGLGTDYSQPVKEGFNLGGINTAPIPGEQPMTFNFARARTSLFRNIGKGYYLGLSYNLDYHYDIHDQLLNLTDSVPVVTSHYAYNKTYGYDSSSYISSGFGLSALYDTRDHTLNPYKGTFAMLSLQSYPTWLGSSKGYTSFYGEYRIYIPTSTEIARNVLALWAITQISIGGKPPYLQLPASGYDMYNSTARGYLQGRWRGVGWIGLESEYRFRITDNGLLGGILFANGTTTSRPEVSLPQYNYYRPKLQLLDEIRYAVGGGLRIMLDRRGRMNLSVEYARGENGSSGVYVYVGESF
jgi:outer membrane protein assembly factor BamA